MNHCTLDFETASACDLLEAGSWAYAEHPTTEILCVVYSYNSKLYTWLPGQPRGLLGDLAANELVMMVAHNHQFEKAIWRNHMVPFFGFADIEDERWEDTMATAAQRALPQALDEVAVALRLPMAKDTEGRTITLGLSKPRKDGSYDRSEATLKRVIEYCAVDVEVEEALLKRLGPLPESERVHWLQNVKMNQRGLRIDVAYVEKCMEIVEKASTPLIEEHIAICGLKPSQNIKLKAWVNERLKPTGFQMTKMDKEALVEVLGGSIDEAEDESLAGDVASLKEHKLPDDVRRVLEIRQLVGSSSIKKLPRMLACLCEDGKARGLSQYHGTAPGRSAGRLWQPYNIPRPTFKGKVKPDVVVDTIMTGDPEYVQMVLGASPIEAVVSGLRHAIISDPGHVFLSGDYSGIQARVVLALAGAHDKTALMAAGKDVYCDLGSQIHGRPINKEDDPEERQDGKNGVLGCGFGMGWRKFKIKYAKHHPDSFCQHIIHTYRKEWAPEVPNLWYGLERAATKAVWDGKPQEAYGIEYRVEDGFLTARLPSGRKLSYWNPQKTRRAVPWDETDLRPGVSFQAQKNGQLITVNGFGGQWTENVVMGIEVDIHRHGQLNCEKAGMPIVHECYDEVVAQVLENNADLETFYQCMLDTPRWVKELKIPVAVEGWMGTRYRK